MKKSLLFVLSLMFVMVSLSAEDSPFSSEVQPQSNTYRASAGIFDNDVDKFMDVGGFSSMDGNGILFLGATQNDVEVGYSTLLGGVYLGGYYLGNVIETWGDQNSEHSLTTESETDTLFDALFNKLGETETITTFYGDNQHELTTDYNNKGAVILGFGNLGIEVSVNQEMTKDEAAYDDFWTPTFNNDKEVTITNYDALGNMVSQEYDLMDGEILSSNVTPAISAGITLDTGSMTIIPRFNFAFGINSESRELTELSYDTVVVTGRTVEGMDDITAYYNLSENYNANSFVIDTELSSEFKMDKNDSEISFGIGYGLNMPIYSSAYTTADGSDETVKGGVFTSSETDYDFITNPGVTEITQKDEVYLIEISEMTHKISPMVKVKKEISDRLSLGAKLSIPVTISTYSEERNYENTEVITSTDVDVTSGLNFTDVSIATGMDNNVERTSFDILPELNVGLRYEVVPSKLVLSGGINYTLPGYTSSTQTTTNGYETRTETSTNDVDGTTTTAYDSDIADPTTSEEVKTQDWYDMHVDVDAGMELFFTDAISLDLRMSTSWTNINAASFSAQFVIRR